MRWRGILARLLASVAVAGCGGGSSGSKFEGTTILLTITPSNPFNVMSSFSVEVYGSESGGCPLSPQATLTINGTPHYFGSCTATSDVFEGNPSFELQAADGGDRAEMAVAGLVPGIDAAVASPLGGQVAAGGSLTVSFPSAFQGQAAQYGDFQNTDNRDSYSGMLTYPTSNDGESADVPAPQHPASYVLWVAMGPAVGSSSPMSISADVLSCSGFEHCYSDAIEVLGPMMIDVTP